MKLIKILITFSSKKDEKEMRRSNEQALVTFDTKGDSQQLHFKW